MTIKGGTGSRSLLSGWLLRASYVISLIAVAGICLQFYFRQKEQGVYLESVQVLGNRLADADLAMREMAEKAVRIAEIMPSREDDYAIRALVLGKSLSERREILRNRKPDPNILASRQALEFQRARAVEKWDGVLEAWREVGPELSTAIAQSSPFMSLDDPFRHFHSLLERKTIDDVRTRSEMHWAARSIAETYSSYVEPSADAALETLRRLQRDAAKHQGVLLERFLLICLAVLGVLGFFVFIPVDFAIQSMMKRLAGATRQAEEATRSAEAADRAKSEFLANMSHEIRTPMNGVMGMAELLARSELDARQRTFVDVIVKSGAALLTIINDILDFSKIDAGQMQLDPAPFRLAEAVEDVATLVSSRVAEKDLELAVRVDPALPERFVGDVGRLRQIITNLMGNAVKFTERGHVIIDVTGQCVGKVEVDENALPEEFAEAAPADLWRLCIRIEDTGIGIPADKLATIFDKFSQVDGSATRKHEGTGLGLAIASSLVRLMGGEMKVESQSGKGSVFSFDIQLAALAGSGRRSRPSADFSGARVLIIDDNAVNRAILIEQFAAWRFDAAAAEGGAQALAVLEEAHRLGVSIDLVVLDYHMPLMNGGEAASRIAAFCDAKGLPRVPVVMLTSVDETEDGRSFSSLGVAAQLTKPARSSLLLETVINVLADARARRAGSSTDHDAIAAARAIGALASADPASRHGQRLPPMNRELPQGEPATAEIRPAEATPASTSLPIEVESEPVVESHDIARGGSESGERLDILLAEDNEVNRIVFTQILHALPWSFAIATNGEEAVRLFAERAPRLVLMDVSMPVMNGLEATRAIRASQTQSGAPRTPIIGVTAHALKGDMERCLEAGMDDYLTKPVSPAMLEEKIAAWLDPATPAILQEDARVA
jgi:signal transduction histidine kinase/DNA-binding response OmpR family regulator